MYGIPHNREEGVSTIHYLDIQIAIALYDGKRAQAPWSQQVERMAFHDDQLITKILASNSAENSNSTSIQFEMNTKGDKTHTLWLFFFFFFFFFFFPLL